MAEKTITNSMWVEKGFKSRKTHQRWDDFTKKLKWFDKDKLSLDKFARLDKLSQDKFHKIEIYVLEILRMENPQASKLWLIFVDAYR